MLRIMAHFHEEIYSDPDTPTGLNQVYAMRYIDPTSSDRDIVVQNLDFRASIVDHDNQLMDYFKEWSERFKRDSDLTGSFQLIVV